jgi:hypothetical protein
MSLFYLISLPVTPVALGHSIMERGQVAMDVSDTHRRPVFSRLFLAAVFHFLPRSSTLVKGSTSGARFTRMTSVEDAIQEYASTSHPALVFGGFVIMRPALAHFTTTSEFIALRQPLIKTNGFKAPFYHDPH